MELIQKFSKFYSINNNIVTNIFLIFTIPCVCILLNPQEILAVPGDLEIKIKLNDSLAEYIPPKPTDAELVKIQGDRYYYKPDFIYLIDNDVQTAAEFIHIKQNIRRCKRYKDIKGEVYVNWWRRKVWKPNPLRYLIPEEPIRQPKYQNYDIRYVI